jgi:ATP-dependent Lon protease
MDAQNGSELAGSSSFFSNAKPGIPFTTLLYSSYANPIFFLDEIDKNSCSSYDALGALYVLLEPGTATTYTDQCYELPIDASHILYIAACNDASLLPDPLRTRFKQFDITISPNQSRQIAESIINSTFASMMPATEGMSVSSRAMDVLSTMTPRKIGQALTEAIGTAFAMGSTVIDHIAAAEPQKSRIGFLP